MKPGLYTQVAAVNIGLVALLLLASFAILIAINFSVLKLPHVIAETIWHLAKFINDDAAPALTMSFVSHLLVFCAGLIGMGCLRGERRTKYICLIAFCVVYLSVSAFELAGLPLTICERDGISCHLYDRTLYILASYILGTPLSLLAGANVGRIMFPQLA